MDFRTFKRLALAKKKGGLKLPDNDTDYSVLIQESLETIAKKTIPTDLVTIDVESDTLRWVNESQLIRMPVAPTVDTDKIDIDEQLAYAVLYDFLANHASDTFNVSRFEAKRDEEISTYEWNNYKFLQELGLAGSEVV